MHIIPHISTLLPQITEYLLIIKHDRHHQSEYLSLFLYVSFHIITPSSSYSHHASLIIFLLFYQEGCRQTIPYIDLIASLFTKILQNVQLLIENGKDYGIPVCGRIIFQEEAKGFILHFILYVGFEVFLVVGVLVTLDQIQNGEETWVSCLRILKIVF